MRPGRWLATLRTMVRETLALRAKQGPYRYLVRSWEQLDDLELAAAVMGTDFHAATLQPLPLPVANAKRLLVLAPHQDDETIGAGGTLRIAADAGVDLHIAFVTDGAQRNPTYASSTVDGVAIRDAEAVAVCGLLGAHKHDLGIDNLAPRPTRDDIARLATLIRDLAPDAVMLPWLLDRPAKHRLVCHMLWLAARLETLPAFEVWGYQVHNALYPNSFVDITAVADAKRQLLACYPSQNEHTQRYDHLAMAMSAWNSRLLADAPVARFVETFHTQPSDAFFAQLETLYFRDLKRTYRAHGPVLAAAISMHRAVAGEPPPGAPPDLVAEASP